MKRNPAKAGRWLRLLVACSFLAAGPALAASIPAQAASAQTIGSSLAANQRLLAGQELVSPNGEYSLRMQGDGNLVIYAYGVAVWSSQTGGTGNWAVMQGDGNFVVYSKAGKALWSTKTNVTTKPTVEATLESTGFLEIFHNGKAAWSSKNHVHVLPEGQRLEAGQALYSPSGEYELLMQGDGNLVIYAFGKAVWSSGTSGSGAWAIMQGDGNFVVYSAGGTALWSTRTSATGSLEAEMESSGSLNILHDGAALWSSGSHATELPPGKTLWGGDTLYSPNGAYHLDMQGDGNLVLYQGSSVRWSTGTNDAGDRAKVLSNHTFAVVDSSGGGQWTTPTVSGATGSGTISVLNNGNVALTSGGKLLWSRLGAKNTVPYEIVSLAESQDQFGAAIEESPDGSNCNRYTYYWWVRGERPYSVNNSCAPGTRSEEWCSDFAQWAWSQYGVNTGDTTGAAISFVSWGKQFGAFHSGKTNDPEPGDTVVWGNSSLTYAAHVAIVVGVEPGGVLATVNGNGGPNTDRVDFANVTESSTIDGYPIVGYISPVNGSGVRFSTIQSPATKADAARASSLAKADQQQWLSQVATQDGGH